jgi:hypothetical protein
METTDELLHVDKSNLLQWKIIDMTVSFIWIIILFDSAFEYGSDLKFWGCVGTIAVPLCVCRIL